MAYLSDEDIRASLLERHRWSLDIPVSGLGIRVSPYGDDGTHGAVCPMCAPQWEETLRTVDSLPMMTGPYGGPPDNSHKGSYLAEARFAQWACANGRHGRIRFARY